MTSLEEKCSELMQSAEEMRSKLTVKAMEDVDFRHQLVTDPKGTVNREFGIEIPENITIKMHESDMNTLHLALPSGPEISEEQLEAVAAGLCCCGL